MVILGYIVETIMKGGKKMKTKLNFQAVRKKCNSHDLKIGEMMILDDTAYPEYHGHILIKIYDEILSLSDPSIVWNEKGGLNGSKLLPGESITLIQE